MNLSLFHLPPAIYNLLPALGAAALAFIGYLLGSALVARIEKNTAGRLEKFAAQGEKAGGASATLTRIGSHSYRVQLAFSRFNIDVHGREDYFLWLARIAVGGGLTLAMLLFGLPFLTSLIGLIAGYVLVDGIVTRDWNKMRTDIEAEIPALLSGLKSNIATAPNVPDALADTARTLKKGGPLRNWAEKTASRMHTEGQPCITLLLEEASAVSSSLAVCVELISRMWTTGGAGYAQAFESAAANLREVLNARVLARARGSGAQGTTNLLMGMAFGTIVFLNHVPAMAATVRTPLVQVAYAIIFLVLVYGYNMINDMIENAV
ncbi:MAG: hypothetical protein WCE68_00370 [Anaerolineales bacterium]